MEININDANCDIYDRYKMERIIVSYTGQGKNSRTIINNLDNICVNIHTSPNLLLQYIGNSLGTNTITPNIIKGHYIVNNIQDIVYDFIHFLILCQKCCLPEVSSQVIINNKTKMLIIKCSACGASYELVGNNKINSKLVSTMCKLYYNK